jgi:hypothetical protein
MVRSSVSLQLLSLTEKYVKNRISLESLLAHPLFLHARKLHGQAIRHP